MRFEFVGTDLNRATFAGSKLKRTFLYATCYSEALDSIKCTKKAVWIFLDWTSTKSHILSLDSEEKLFKSVFFSRNDATCYHEALGLLKTVENAVWIYWTRPQPSYFLFEIHQNTFKHTVIKLLVYRFELFGLDLNQVTPHWAETIKHIFLVKNYVTWYNELLNSIKKASLSFYDWTSTKLHLTRKWEKTF